VSSAEAPSPSVVIVGGGFAGVGCAKELAKHGASVTLLDRHDYHQFQPLLHPAATGELSTTGIARLLRAIFKGDASVAVRELLGSGRASAIVDDPDVIRIDWGDDDVVDDTQS